jgi:hypothetical protein
MRGGADEKMYLAARDVNTLKPKPRIETLPWQLEALFATYIAIAYSTRPLR